MRYLLLTIRFLDSRYHGMADGGEREWPPSPMRLFASLLAGAKAHWTDARRESFMWLECQPPPLIRATVSQPGSDVLTYVPNNNSDSGQIVRTGKVMRPTLLEDPPVVEYLWEVTLGDEKYAKIVAEAAQHVRALGWGIDMAIGHGRVVESLPPCHGFAVFTPSDHNVGGGATLRVPIEGSLRSLEVAYDASLSRIRANGEVHDQPGPPTCDRRFYAVSGARPLCSFSLQTADEEIVACRPQRIKQLVGMIRHAAVSEVVRQAVQRRNDSASAEDIIDVDRMILGHPRDAAGPRLSILPLPSIGHPLSDGLIRRVILAESVGGGGVLCQLLFQLLCDTALTPENANDVISTGEVQLKRLGSADHFLRCYIGSADTWATVTPVLLPGYDDRKMHRGDHRKRLDRAEQLVCKALSHAGIDVPAQIELSRVPYWLGTLHAREYQPRDKLSHYPRWHVRLTFDRTWTGPLAIGAGRHCGFGLFAARTWT